MLLVHESHPNHPSGGNLTTKPFGDLSSQSQSPFLCSALCQWRSSLSLDVDPLFLSLIDNLDEILSLSLALSLSFLWGLGVGLLRAVKEVC